MDKSTIYFILIAVVIFGGLALKWFLTSLAHKGINNYQNKQQEKKNEMEQRAGKTEEKLSDSYKQDK